MNKKSRVWKIVAISMVILFILIIAGGIIKLQRAKASFAAATPEQKSTAEAAVTKDLEARGLNASEYSIEVVGRVMRMKEAGKYRNLMQAFADSNASRHSYLIDMDSGVIMLHSQTETYGWMAEIHNKMMCPRCKGMPPGTVRPGGPENLREPDDEGYRKRQEMPGPITRMPRIW
ncbi:hypothetical protein JW898_05575 [Candidatus Woesearchaeota archaeon]|nr:hypothetical protein [Candidatus Woesearchaeota archaeon]